MDTFMLVVEIFGAIWLTLAIFMLGWNYKWWLFYAAANIPFAITTVHKGCYWYTLMGCVLCVSGIRNYFIEKKKEKIDAKKEAMSRLR